MPDLGHDLLFGSFLTPSAQDPRRTVELGVLAEQVGLDLVTVQDHPYQPSFLDTWTLLSFLAARTSSVRLAPNVANLPLRPPAVLARSAASLDLLSDGRVELGLGAGAFWDAIERMGGRRLAPGEAVAGLEEAIEVIRGIWAADARGGVRVEGEVHRVVGAKRGPAPAHDVGIWLGAYKPRMLRLVGRRADGWLPSMGYLKPGDLTAGNARVDDAAHEAGRAPADVRRLLNLNGRFLRTAQGPLQGPPDQWVEELTDLALTEGVSGFILGGDDPEDLRRFAAEVAPAVREAVTAERAVTERVEEQQGDGTAGPGRAGPRTEARVGAAAPLPEPATGRRQAADGEMGGAGGGFPVAPTPDDGHRRSDERAWDESTRPAGPPRDPDRRYTAHDLATGQHLVDVHDSMRQELARLHDLVEQVATGATDPGAARSHIATMTIRQNNWVLGTYCESYCRVVTTHHTLEDRSMFPHLRSSEPRLGPVIDRLQEEHHVIHDVLERVDRALVALVQDPHSGIDAVRDAVDLLSDVLLSHFAYEERELLEPIARFGLG